MPRCRSQRTASQVIPAPITLSCGVAAYPVHGPGAEELIRAADQALYQAKESGRDRVVVAGAPQATESR